MSGTEYPKIETLYDRNPENMKHVLLGQLRDPAFDLISRWIVTEKIHGTNVRVIYENGDVRIGGRTDDAQMPLFLLDALRERFPVSLLSSVWPSIGEKGVDEALTEHPSVVLYGEGYGAKIQKGGGNYNPDPSFRLFDVKVLGKDSEGAPHWWWLVWPAIEDVATKLGIKTVPVLSFDATMEEALSFVAWQSHVALHETGIEVSHEGIVCRTDPPLFLRSGERLMWKLKGRDLPEAHT